MRALGNRDARRNDVAIHGTAVADVDLLARADVADHLAQHDDRFGEHLCLDLAVGSDRQHVIAKLDFPFDVSFDRQVLTAIQLALDDH